MPVKNGVQADQLAARWRKSRISNPSGSCVELAELPGDAIAVRNSRYPSGPALIYTRAEVAAFLSGAKNGEFDDLYQDGSLLLTHGPGNGATTVRACGDIVLSVPRQVRRAARRLPGPWRTVRWRVATAGALGRKRACSADPTVWEPG
jgi:Domain of unknown function (DUF397)